MKLSNLFTLKASAVAVAALLAGNAFAAVNLDTAPVSVKFASEQTVAGTGSTLTRNPITADMSATVTVGATFAIDAVAYVRFDLSSGVFNAAPTATVTGGAANLSQGGAGQNFVIFALTPGAGTALAAAAVVTLTAPTLTVTSQTAVNMTYRTFETLTNAANQTLPLKTVSAAPFVAFTPALTYTATAAATAPIADVSQATLAYSDFTVIGEKPLGIGQITVNTVAKQDGTAATAADVLSGTNSLSVTGDFTFAASAGLYDATALSRINLDTSATCANANAGNPAFAASTLSGTTATFAAIASANLVTGLTLCVNPQPGVTAINASAYTGAFTLVPQTGYTVTSPRAAAYASITRNGTVLQAPLIQTTAGYITRFALTNTGSTPATFTTVVRTEAGNACTLGTGTTGTIPANGQLVIAATDICTGFTAGQAARGAAIFTINAPTNNIQGVFQVVNAGSGSVSNTVMVRPGTN